MNVTFTLEGFDELHTEWNKACDTLDTDLNIAVAIAAEEGVQAEQSSHPYEDRTYGLTETATVEMKTSSRGDHIVNMYWPEKYASFVDKGTTRSKAYPFVLIAERAAKERLLEEVDIALRHFVGRIESF